MIRVKVGPRVFNFNLGVNPNIGGKPPNHPFGNRVFHYFHHPFWGTPIFGNIHFDSSLWSFQIVALTLEMNLFNSSDAILKLGDVRCLDSPLVEASLEQTLDVVVGV